MVLFSCLNWLKFALNIPIWLTQSRHQTCYLHTGLGYTSACAKSRVEVILIEDDAGLLSLKDVLGKTVYFGLRIKPPTSRFLKKDECKAVSTKYVSIWDNTVMNLICFQDGHNCSIRLQYFNITSSLNVKVTFQKVISLCPDVQQLFSFHDARVATSDVSPEVLVEGWDEFEFEFILWEVHKIFANKVLAQCEGNNQSREFTLDL